MKKIPPGCEFTPGMLVEMIFERFGQHVGMVIDLTNTKRYYDAMDWKELQVNYVKVPQRLTGERGVGDTLLRKKRCLVSGGSGTRLQGTRETLSLEADRINAVQMPCRGRGQTPEEATVNNFTWEVMRFNEAHPELLIAIHCTHGFNRTGKTDSYQPLFPYLCSYLSLVSSVSPF